MAISDNPTVTLRELTPQMAFDITNLDVGDAQKQFVASNLISIAQAYFEKNHWMRAIYANDEPVGFIMLYDDPITPKYFLWRLMVDQRHQGKGYGRSAIQHLIEYVKTRPQATELFVSYVPGEGSPAQFYEKLGFEDTGEMEGSEKVLRLTLDTSDVVPSPKPVTHVVMAKLKEGADAAELAAKLRDLQGKVPSLRDVEVGVDKLHTPRSYDIVLTARFDDWVGLEAYQADPEHQKVLAYMRDVVETAIAVDYEN
jgi:diamine N-acetyltransferase